MNNQSKTTLNNFINQCASSGMSSIPVELINLAENIDEYDVNELNQKMLEDRQKTKAKIENKSLDIYKKRLLALRQWMKKNNYSWLLVKRTDSWLNEDISHRWQHIAWLTGFSGSNATLLIGLEKACIFSDSRYELQLQTQINLNIYDVVMEESDCISAWLCQQNQSFNTLELATDYSQISQKVFFELSKKLKNKNIILVSLLNDPFCEIWKERPNPPVSLISIHENKYSGKIWQEKHIQILDYLKKENKDALLITQADAIAWLFNIRAEDVFNSPLWLCNGMFYKDGAISLYSYNRLLTDELHNHLGLNINIKPFEKCKEDILKHCKSNKSLLFSPNYTSYSLVEKLEIKYSKLLFNDNNFTVKIKSKLNFQEIFNSFDVHLRDGQKMVQLLAWISRSPSASLKESSVQKKIYELRSKDNLYKGESFPAISAVGPNSALPHYQVSESQNSTLSDNKIFLIDCGGQYLDGTTDITRTIFLGNGNPSTKEKLSYTLVLKGMIAVSCAVFPSGTDGKSIDILARQFMWQYGFNFNHGTGHGIGRYLCVHEGPYSIGKNSSHKLIENILITNEPGLYFPNEFGIRIENVILSTRCNPKNFNNNSKSFPSLDFSAVNIINKARENILNIHPWLAFTTLTMCPYNKKLIDKYLLSSSELSWINEYHKIVREKLILTLDSDNDRKWLELSTSPL